MLHNNTNTCMYIMMHWFVFILIISLVYGNNQQNSCVSDCSDVSSPRCGTWIQEENLEESSGIYLLDEGFINLTCTFTSLPSPITVDWTYQPHHTSTPAQVKCSSLKTTKQCSINKLAEHSVSSTCFLKIQRLDQSGFYHCGAKDEKGGITKSKDGHIKVYGIDKVETLEQQTIHYGQIDIVELMVCAHPKPQVIWMHTASAEIVTSGGKPGTRFIALDLIEYVHIPHTRARIGAVFELPNCYISQIVINDIIGVQDGVFSVMVSNTVDHKTVTVHVDVVGVPIPTVPSASSNTNINVYVLLSISFFCLISSY